MNDRNESKPVDKNRKDQQLDYYTEHPEETQLTTNQGVKVSRTDDSLKAGLRGPPLMENSHFRETITHFDHERIPERVVHAMGTGAFGYFECLKAHGRIYGSQVPLGGGKEDPSLCAVLHASFRGSADTVRDVRDFATKFYTEELISPRKIGRLVLNKTHENFFAEVEQVAFCPGNVVKGIDFTNDPLLQARLFSYIDTQIGRLGGPNFHEILVNRPIAPAHNNQRDAMHRMMINTSKTSYFPNCLGSNYPMSTSWDQDGYTHYMETLHGDGGGKEGPGEERRSSRISSARPAFS
jgi:catalase